MVCFFLFKKSSKCIRRDLFILLVNIVYENRNVLVYFSFVVRIVVLGDIYIYIGYYLFFMKFLKVGGLFKKSIIDICKEFRFVFY